MTVLRPWAPGDDLDGLLDAVADPLFASQGHALHGPDRDADRWRRTTVAVAGGEVVGAVTVARNRFHPGRWSAVIEVAPDHRRRGLGSLLLRRAREVRPDGRPLAGKVRPSTPADGFVRTAGGRAYQHCTCARVGTGGVTGRAASTLEERPVPDLGDLLVAQYRWVHAAWSPVSPDAPVSTLAAVLTGDVRTDLSAASWSDDHPAALAVVFPGAGAWVVLAETVHEQQPDGDRHHAAAVSRALAACAEAGIGEVEFDGHVTDPHLHLLLQQLPRLGTDPLDLVEVG